MRPVISVLKSLFKHLKKLNVIKRDILLTFDNVKQKQPRHERTMSVATVKFMFKEALKQSTPISFHIMQLFVYAGLRRTVLSKLLRSDIVRTEFSKNGEVDFRYSVKARDAKGGKNRTIGLKSDVGRSLYDYASSLTTEYLFPGKKDGHLGSGAVAIRIKVLARKVGKPEISCHWMRHAFATWSLHAGANLVDVSKALGHSSVAVTSLYLHSSDKPVSALIDLSTLVNGETVDDTIIYVKTETSKKSRVKIKAPKKGKKRKTNNGISL
jgi:integrase/recombinase XerD